MQLPTSPTQNGLLMLLSSTVGREETLPARAVDRQSIPSSRRAVCGSATSAKSNSPSRWEPLWKIRPSDLISGWLLSGCWQIARTESVAMNSERLSECGRIRHGSCFTESAKLCGTIRALALVGRETIVESDETFVGPNPRKMHNSRRVKLQQIRGQQRRGDVGVGKTAVAGILDRETRRVRAKVVPNVRRDTLQAAILNSIAPAASSTPMTPPTTDWRWRIRVYP